MSSPASQSIHQPQGLQKYRLATHPQVEVTQSFPFHWLSNFTARPFVYGRGICHYSIILAQSRKANTTRESFYLPTQGKSPEIIFVPRIRPYSEELTRTSRDFPRRSIIEAASTNLRVEEKKDLCVRSKATSFKSFPRREDEQKKSKASVQRSRGKSRSVLASFEAHFSEVTFGTCLSSKTGRGFLRSKGKSCRDSS